MPVRRALNIFRRRRHPHEKPLPLLPPPDETVSKRSASRSRWARPLPRLHRRMRSPRQIGASPPGLGLVPLSEGARGSTRARIFGHIGQVIRRTVPQRCRRCRLRAAQRRCHRRSARRQRLDLAVMLGARQVLRERMQEQLIIRRIRIRIRTRTRTRTRTLIIIIIFIIIITMR